LLSPLRDSGAIAMPWMNFSVAIAGEPCVFIFVAHAVAKAYALSRTNDIEEISFLLDTTTKLADVFKSYMSLVTTSDRLSTRQRLFAERRSPF
jgi:hypothetical protein